MISSHSRALLYYSTRLTWPVVILHTSVLISEVILRLLGSVLNCADDALLFIMDSRLDFSLEQLLGIL